jgi:CDP-6-deoxy-D-xylo-4-hexulose-3-dehydrase
MLKLSESSWGAEEIDVAIECLKKDNTTMGAEVENFEKSFADKLNSRYAIMVNSGSSANLLGAATISYMDGVDLKRNVVLVPALSWSTTYFPWVQLGYKLRFVDIDLETFNIDLVDLENKLDDKVCGICVPHILGADAGAVRIQKICLENNLWLFEDTCESLGGTSNEDSGIFLGSLGRFGTFSFFRSHHISTMEGGMLLTNSFEDYAVAKSLRAHGWSRNIPFSKHLNNSDSNEWDSRFKFYAPGFNLRPLEISGAIGNIQLKKLDYFLEMRRKNAKLLNSLLSNNKVLKLQKQESGGSWMAFAFIIIDQKINRHDLVAKLENCGFETRPVVTGNFLKQPVIDKIRKNIEAEGDFRKSDIIHENGFMMANHGRDLSQELKQFLEIINSF